MDYLTIKATGVKEGLIDEKLAIKLGKNDVIVFYKGLEPWIKKQEETYCGSFDDLKEFYKKCKDEDDRIRFFKTHKSSLSRCIFQSTLFLKNMKLTMNQIFHR